LSFDIRILIPLRYFQTLLILIEPKIGTNDHWMVLYRIRKKVWIRNQIWQSPKDLVYSCFYQNIWRCIWSILWFVYVCITIYLLLCYLCMFNHLLLCCF
jgi:hypothetical protein